MLRLSYLVGEKDEDTETWFCVDGITNKFYKKTTKFSNDNILETIEEVPQELVERYAVEHMGDIL